MGLNASMSPEAIETRILRDQSSSGVPIPIDSQIRNAEINLRGALNLRTYHYITGDLRQARLHAIRIGCMRAQLRRMKARMS